MRNKQILVLVDRLIEDANLTNDSTGFELYYDDILDKLTRAEHVWNSVFNEAEDKLYAF